ncbi:hypothetical protein CN581_26945 [Bacillus toyonensis]|uniref:hypothetical protein n=1 Tax=Bacillus toyonensis TaxID=155322 RepID=UPI000BF94410|nr:hypothetical protein [Bacillus toyonensis]PEP75444.1 hypothetical protein CN581_26945 [Bacillus toyonensis]
MNHHFRNCGPGFFPAAVLKPPNPPIKPTIESMTKLIQHWVYLWSFFGYTGWIFILRVGVEQNPDTKKLEPAIWGCNPDIGNIFFIFLKDITNYKASY